MSLIENGGIDAEDTVEGGYLHFEGDGKGHDKDIISEIVAVDHVIGVGHDKFLIPDSCVAVG